MTSTSFDKNGLDKAGIHWMQYLSMTSMSLLIFLIALDKAVPSFHQFVLLSGRECIPTVAWPSY